MKRKVLLTLVVWTATLNAPSNAQTSAKIDSLVFADYCYNVNNNTPAEKDRNAFQFRFINFMYENNITDAIKVRFRLVSEPRLWRHQKNQLICQTRFHRMEQSDSPAQTLFRHR